MEKFLDSLSKGTMKSYRRGLELFIEPKTEPHDMKTFSKNFTLGC
jgi:hypothetical protein